MIKKNDDNNEQITSIKTRIRKEENNLVLPYSSKVDLGVQRELNEDSILTSETTISSHNNTQRIYMFIVADGMGGHNKGELASNMAVTYFHKKFTPVILDLNRKNICSEIKNTLLAVNKEILNYSINHSECEGMGTTFTVAIIHNQILYVSHVGDSRVYLIDSRDIIQITKDHSLVQEMIDRREITKEEAKRHSKKNVITRVIGYFGDVKIDAYEHILAKNDYILLCSDGLSNYIEDNEIFENIHKYVSSEYICEKLVKLAKDRGGSDNISIILYKNT